MVIAIFIAGLIFVLCAASLARWVLAEITYIYQTLGSMMELVADLQNRLNEAEQTIVDRIGDL